ncbi:hypothetical protein C0583_05745 [Candidatus Parcubacteria bacterium]|nr:MAG: hypothetical protein C0583_05745 [Candidatus Parcubacteria bacterium]
MKYIKETSWNEIFQNWAKRESNNPAWIRCATEIKGWPNWESWRGYTANLFNAKNRKWSLYKFENPKEEILNMLIGPYTGWQSKVKNKNNTTFKELLDIPEQFNELSHHEGVINILNGLPFNTEMIGIKRKDSEKIILIEGHHRAVAITLAKLQKKPIEYSKTRITIALTDIDIDEIEILDKMLEQGSTNPNV